MKKALVSAFALLASTGAQASDSAGCVVYMNGFMVDEATVYHQDYDVNVSGIYSYRTYKRDEFYDLNYSYVTTSNPASYQIRVNLVGTENQFQSEGVIKNPHGTAMEASVTDHEGNQIQVKCQIN